MEISLNPKSKAFVANQIQHGRFKDINEAINEGLNLLEEREKWLDEEIKRGLDSGTSSKWDKQEILQAARKKYSELKAD